MEKQREGQWSREARLDHGRHVEPRHVMSAARVCGRVWRRRKRREVTSLGAGGVLEQKACRAEDRVGWREGASM